MDKKVPAVVAVVAIIVAVIGLSVGVKATSAKNSALQQVEELQARLQSGSPAIARAATRSGGSSDLEAQLADQNAELIRQRAQLADAQAGGRQGAMRGGNRGAMDPAQMDPEALAQMQQQRAEQQQQRTQRQQDMLTQANDRVAAFANMDTSRMTAEERANHNQLVQAMTSAMNLAQGGMDPNDPAAMESMRDAMGSMRQIGDLMDNERTMLFRQLGEDVGLSGADAQDFANYVDEVIQNTSMEGIGGIGGRGGMGGMGGRGGRGGMGGAPGGMGGMGGGF